MSDISPNPGEVSGECFPPINITRLRRSLFVQSICKCALAWTKGNQPRTRLELSCAVIMSATKLLIFEPKTL
jgi:hypothetical protein